MPRKKWMYDRPPLNNVSANRPSDKSASTTYALVHRPQNDPKIHDASSSSMVFQELDPSQAHKSKNLTKLESELFGNAEEDVLPGVRDNEGEAAEHGIYYDDTEYDYMQHMRDLKGGSGDGGSYFVEAPIRKQGKGKERIKLEDALKNASLEDAANKKENALGLLDEDLLPSKNLKKGTYQDQQDVPDVLSGFQPDMDPRLREVLEALDDEAYVDEEEDLFGELAKDGREVSSAEFEELGFAEEDDGWETDDTAKPRSEYKTPFILLTPGSVDMTMEEDAVHGEGEWMKEFSKFKKAEKSKEAKQPRASDAELQSSVLTGTSMTGGRRKKRKGAMTSDTGYSMTSSSLARTEGLTLLDARFDKIEEEYAEDNDEMMDDGASMMSRASGMSRMSSVSKVTGISEMSGASSQAPPLRSDFENIVDEFLGGYSISGKKRVKKGRYQSGLEQLDEVRKGLGPARINVQKTS